MKNHVETVICNVICSSFTFKIQSCKINLIKLNLFHMNKLSLIFVFSKFGKIMADTIL